MKDIIVIVISVIGTLGGAFLGGYFTRKSQLDLFKLQTSEEDRKKKSEIEEARLKVYISTLKMNRELSLVEKAGGNTLIFDLERYEEYLRTSLFNNYHLVHHNVARTVMSIDDRLAECDYNEEVTNEDHQVFSTLYFQLLEQIEAHIDQYREKLFK